MDLRHLTYLDAVARNASFTAAADELFVAQPAVSQAIKQLELEFGTTLIDRANKRPTEAGELVLARARQAFAELETAREQVRELIGLKRGTLRAGAIHWLEPLDLPVLLHEYTTLYPGIAISLHEYDARVMFDMLQQRQLDIVFSNISPGADLPNGLERKLLFTEPLVVGVNPSHPLAGRTSISLADLRDEPFIGFRSGSAFRDTVDHAFKEAGISPLIRFESSDLVTVRKLTAAGLGVALMPQSLATFPGAPLTVLSVDPHPPERTVALTWRSDLTSSPATRAFLDLTLEWVAAPNIGAPEAGNTTSIDSD
jgi:DNA-binding transcriptional LysR family regulator